MIDIKINGLAELQKRLEEVPAKIEKNILRSGLRAGMKEVLPEARRNIRSRSGLLAKGLKIGSGGRGGRVFAYMRARGKHGFIAKWLEFGTKAHWIENKQKTKKRPGRIEKLAMRIGAGDFVRGTIPHPGISEGPKAFMRPALEAKAAAAVQAMAEHMRERLATEHGLDTADLTFDVEEG